MKMVQKLWCTLVAVVALAACQQETTQQQQPVVPQTQAPVVQEAVASVASGASQAAADPAHNANQALDWAGTYVGKLPCASCDHIATTLVLNQDGSYVLTSDYQGGKEKLVVKEEGKIDWEDDGKIIELEPRDHKNDDHDGHIRFFVAEGHVQQLAEGSKQYVEGSPYRLDKQAK